MKKVFIIDDEADLIIMLKAWCEKKGFEVTTFESADGFLDSLLEAKPELIFIDINLKNDDGRLISQHLKKVLPFTVKIILISGEPMALLDYQEYYADGILNKPFTFLDLEKKLYQHLSK